jgi:hypothetical protein
MTNLRRLLVASLAVVAFSAGVLIGKYGDAFMGKTRYLKLQEPMVLNAGGESQYRYLLPAGTPLFTDESFPEGHTRYKVYVNIKGAFASEEMVSDKTNLIVPIWAETLKKDEVQQLLAEIPIPKDDLVKVLKARKMTRDELAQIVRDWKD